MNFAFTRNSEKIARIIPQPQQFNSGFLCRAAYLFAAVCRHLLSARTACFLTAIPPDHLITVTMAFVVDFSHVTRLFYRHLQPLSVWKQYMRVVGFLSVNGISVELYLFVVSYRGLCFSHEKAITWMAARWQYFHNCERFDTISPALPLTHAIIYCQMSSRNLQA